MKPLRTGLLAILLLSLLPGARAAAVDDAIV